MKLSLMSKYRTHIMGFAMIIIMWFHSPYVGQALFYDIVHGLGWNDVEAYMHDVFKFIHRIGFYGVDIFLLLSGLGLYFSMRKSRSIGDFYKKRAIRILPAYLIITIAWYAFYRTEVSFGDKVLSVLGINYFRGTIYNRPEYFDWFLPTLFVLYLIIPLYDKLFQKVTVKWKFTLLMSMISPILCIVGYSLNMQPLYGSFVRIPVFFIGYSVGWFLYEKKEEQKGSWMVHVSLLIMGVSLAYFIHNNIDNRTVFYGLNAYPALLVAPAVAVTLGVIFKFAEDRLRIVGKVLLFPFYICGRYSLEIYLIHQRFIDIINSDIGAPLKNSLMSIFKGKWYYIMLGVISVLLACILHELIDFVIRMIKNAFKKPSDPAKPAEKEKASKPA